MLKDIYPNLTQEHTGTKVPSNSSFYWRNREATLCLRMDEKAEAYSPGQHILGKELSPYT